MNSSFSDPPPVPEDISADDRNGSDGSSAAINPPPAVVLPPHRSDKEQLGSRPIDGRNIGLRIDANVKRGTSPNTSRVKVQKIHPSLGRIEQSVPSPPKPSRKGTHHKRSSRHKNPKNPHGEGASWGQGHHHPTPWILVSGVAVIAIVICAMMLLRSSNKRNAPLPGMQAKAVHVTKPNETEELRGLLAKRPEAMKIFHAYISATHVEEIIPLVRNGSTMTKLLSNNWQPSPVPKSWVPSESTNWTVSDHDGYSYGILHGALPDGSKFTAYFSYESDRLQLDWKATVAYGSATFAELEKNQGNPAEIRGEISATDFYTASWPEADYQSYRLLSADKETNIWCYARRGSAVEESITPQLRKIGGPSGSQRITLQLERGPDGSLPNQWLIGEMLHLDWITP